MSNRLEISIKSVEATLELLREVCASPENFKDNSELMTALSSQGKLAKYQNSKRAIRSMSLNTFKAAAEYIIGGFQTVDKRRKEAAAAIYKLSISLDIAPTDSSTAKIRAINELKARVASLQASNLILLQIIGRTLTDLADITNTASPDLRKRLKAESEERIHAALSTNAPPFDSIVAATVKLRRN